MNHHLTPTTEYQHITPSLAQGVLNQSQCLVVTLTDSALDQSQRSISIGFPPECIDLALTHCTNEEPPHRSIRAIGTTDVGGCNKVDTVLRLLSEVLCHEYYY